jgi:hypothetical protein
LIEWREFQARLNIQHPRIRMRLRRVNERMPTSCSMFLVNGTGRRSEIFAPTGLRSPFTSLAGDLPRQNGSSFRLRIYWVSAAGAS